MFVVMVIDKLVMGLDVLHAYKMVVDLKQQMLQLGQEEE
jgi:hypothetical protein